MIRIRRWAISMIAIATLAACAAWDPAVGVRCDQFPAFCRADAGSALVDSSVELPTTGLDAGTDDSGVDAGIEAGPPVSFARDIRPLMNRVETDPSGPGCSLCHYRTTGTQQGIQEGQLDMTTLGDLRRGGKTSGTAVITPGNPNTSILVQKLRGTYGIGSRMPWNGPPYWSDTEIQLVATWIAEGARGEDSE